LRYTCFNMEKAIALMQPGRESVVIVIDYENINSKNSVPFSVAREFLNTMSSHYPERLGMCIMVNASWYFSVALRLLSPFIDNVTLAKLKFAKTSQMQSSAPIADDMTTQALEEKKQSFSGNNTDVRLYVQPKYLLQDYGGNFTWTWDYPSYWSAISAVGKNYTGNSTDAARNAELLAWCDTRCLVRYLKATKFNLDQSLERLAATLKWRFEYAPDNITPEEVAPEADTGKSFLSGFSRDGRPVWYMRPAKQNTTTHDRQLRFTCFNMEKAIALMKPGIESVVIVADHENINSKNSVPFSVARDFLTTMSTHYPERLGICILVNASWYFPVALRLLSPFIDNVTLAKLKFAKTSQMQSSTTIPDEMTTQALEEKKQSFSGSNTDVRLYVQPKYLLEDYCGNFKWTWDYPAYWSAISAIENN
ncbi:hypothetical protein THRCLA_11450, partial [Thraustotheca clavata]